MKVPESKKGRINKMEIKQWEASMFSALRAAVMQNPFDTTNLYLKLEKVSKGYLLNGQMQEGDTFRVPMETGILLDVSFYNNYSTVKANYPDGKSKMLINESDSIKKEYDELDVMSDTLKTTQLGIGPKYSKIFFDTLSKVKPGDVFVFDQGKSLLCDGRLNNMLSFTQVTKECQTPHISEFGKQNRFSLDLDNEASIQKLYREVKDNYTNDIKMSISNITNARGVLNRLLINRDITKELVIGPNRFIVQPSKEGKGLSFLDETGSQIPETQLLVLLSWLDANPNQVEIKDIRPKLPEYEFSDVLFKRQLDMYLAEGYYKRAIQFVCGYCMRHPEVLQIDFSSYLGKEENYEAVRYTFQCIDGEVSIKRLQYKDNDFDKNIISAKECSIEDVIAYCENKYDHKFTYVKNQTLEEIHKEFPKWGGKLFTKIVDLYVESKLSQSPILKADVSYADQDASSLSNISLNDENIIQSVSEMADGFDLDEL